jgi:three-Cys-motif partner protein
LKDNDLYVGREQTLVKHSILQNYLQQFAIVVGFHWDTITYVDCFSGPWNVQSEDFRDSSFAIALEQLRKAREVHRSQGRSLKLRCFFLEKTRSAYLKLKAYTDSINEDDLEILPKNRKLEDAIPDIVRFVSEGGNKSFPFIFVDPKGWTGFAMETIVPLLSIRPGEVLVNFMTEHIRRFIESPQKQTRHSFKRLFGSDGFREKLKGLEKLDREDAIVEAYCDSVRKVGDFPYVSCAVVLNPGRNRTHFHLIYATRDVRGVQVFKAAEKKAMPLMEMTRAGVQERAEVKRMGEERS